MTRQPIAEQTEKPLCFARAKQDVSTYLATSKDI
jgi:hypothetical protein